MASPPALTRAGAAPSAAIGFPETPYGVVKRLVVMREWIARIAAALGKSSLSILDCGCGTGDYVTDPLAQAGHEVLGLDLHAPSIAAARARYALPNLVFRVGTVDELAREGRAFDLVICSEVLEHLHDPGEGLRALRRLVGPGGALIVTTPNGYGAFEWLRALERLLRRTGVHPLVAGLAGRRRAPAPEAGFLNPDSPHVQFFRVAGLERLFIECGLRVRARRARSLLCGPYADHLFAVCPGRRGLFRANNRLADLLPFGWAADWMFWLELDREGL